MIQSGKRILAVLLSVVLLLGMNVVSFGSSEVLGAEPDTATVSGTVTLDFTYDASQEDALKSGFKAEIVGTSYFTLSDGMGNFTIQGVPTGVTGMLKISKANYLYRQIPLAGIHGNMRIPITVVLWAGDLLKAGLQDDAINMSDIMTAAQSFNSVKGDTRYKVDSDINLDGAVNMSDIMIMAKHFNKIPLDYPVLDVVVETPTPIPTVTPTSTPTSTATFGKSLFVALNGNDSVSYENNSINNPWRSPHRAWDMARAGDTVYFRGGTYTSTNPINNQFGGYNGTLEKPITFTSYQGEQATLDFVDIIFTGPFAAGVTLWRDHQHINNLTIKASFSTQTFSGATIYVNGTNAQVTNSTIELVAVPNPDDSAPVVFYPGSNNGEVSNCKIIGFGTQRSSGIHILRGRGLKIQNNDISNCVHGIYLKHSNTLETLPEYVNYFENNYIHHSVNGINGVPNRTVIRNNLLDNCGMTFGGDGGIGDGYVGGDFNTISNNTIYMGTIELIFSGRPLSEDLYRGCMNNILQNNIMAGTKFRWHAYNQPSLNFEYGNHTDFNLYPDLQNDLINENGISYSLSQWINHTAIVHGRTVDAASLVGAPIFVGGVTPNTIAGFALATGSLGKNAGSDGKDMGADVSQVGIQTEETVKPFNPGLLWKEGVAPAPSIPLQSGNRAWYVDANAPSGGNGTINSPFNSFETCIGGTAGDSYQQGLMKGGDHVYLAGEFMAGAVGKQQYIEIARISQYGTVNNPTLITTWPGKPRACFNGGGTKNGVIQMRSVGEPEAGLGIRIDSLEIKNANIVGIQTNDVRLDKFEIINCEIHHTNGSGIQGTGGGLTIGASGLSYTVRNNLFYSNYENQIGGNAGAFTILSEGSALDGTTVDVYDNIFYNEDVAIRHKHSGNITMKAHHNLIHSCNVNTYPYFAGAAFALRAFYNNQIYNNVILNCLEFLVFDKENLQGNFSASVFNNTIVGSGWIRYVHDGSLPQYRMQMHFAQNIYVNPTKTTVVSLGNYGSTPYSMADWSSARNLYTHANASNFLINHGIVYNFVNAMTYMKDATSITDDPEFVDPAKNDFRLTAGSPAHGFGEGGSDIGALPYGSTYILDINRKTVQ